MAAGVSPLEWKQLAKDSTDLFDFSKLQASDARQAVDGRWDLMFVPFRAVSEFDIKGFGVIESYGGGHRRSLLTSWWRTYREVEEGMG
jgi:hypothetical protein